MGTVMVGLDVPIMLLPPRESGSTFLTVIMRFLLSLIVQGMLMVTQAPFISIQHQVHRSPC